MWRDVFLNNNEAVLEMLQRFSEDLSYLQRQSDGKREINYMIYSPVRARSDGQLSTRVRISAESVLADILHTLLITVEWKASANTT